MDELRALLAPDLAGWRMAGRGGFRWVSPGSSYSGPSSDALESYGGPGLLWYASEVFEDLILRVEWRTTRPEDNSGVFIRCPPLAGSLQPAIERGYEVQIDDQGLDPRRHKRSSPLHLTGAIYGLAPVTRVLSRGVALWNEFEIVARQRTIVVNLNGEAVARLDNASREPRGHIALQSHHDGSTVQFRNLRVQAL